MNEWEKLDLLLEAQVRAGQKVISQQMSREYQALRREVMNLIASWGEDVTEWLKYNRQEQFALLLERFTSNAYKPLRKAIVDNLQGVYTAVHPQAMSLLSQATGQTIRGGVTQQAMQTALRTPTAGLTVDIRLDSWERDLARRIHAQVTSGLQKGQNFSEISRDMRDVFGKNGDQLVNMIDVEGHRMESEAVLDAGRHAEAQAGPMMKRWVSVGDSRVRDAHKSLNGKTIPFDEDFVSPAGGRGPAPGMMGNAGDDINCRCVLQVLPEE